MEALKLSEHPQVIDLIQVLEQYGLTRQREEVQSLVGYIEEMENRLDQMMTEVQQMHREVGEIHDGTIRAKCSRLVAMAENKVQQAKTLLSLTKGRVVSSVGSALRTFQEKGRASLRRAVEAMRIPAVLSHLKKGFHYGAETMAHGAERAEAIRQELHEAGGHFKNAGRTLAGKPAQPPQGLESDKGVLAKLHGFFISCGDAFSSMEQGAAQLAQKLQPEKQSVQSEIKQLRDSRTNLPVKPAGREKTR